MITDEIRNFKEKLKDGYVIGPFSKTADPAFIEATGFSGMDFIILDLEHGPNSIETVQNLIRAAQVSGVFPIVRVKEDNPSVIGEALDIGAGGIQVPQITCAEDAVEIIRFSKFSPEGMRGVCRFVRAADYSSMNRFNYFKEANESVIILQVEGENAINNIEKIIEVEGIDILFIGPYDLSQSLGVVGQIDHPDVEDKMVEIIKKCYKKNVVVGTFTDTIENVVKWINAGVKYISYSVDVGIYLEACKSIRSKIKKQGLY